MGQIIDMAAAILTQAERSAEIAGHNITNVGTPAYKRRISFSQLLSLAPETGQKSEIKLSSISDLSNGKMTSTGAPLDVALAGDGFFVVHSDVQTSYTRNGQFSRNADGILVTSHGLAVQDAGGGDIKLGQGKIEITGDGVVLEDGAPVGRLAIVDFKDRTALIATESGAFSASAAAEQIDIERPAVRQGMLETSNVSTGDEMVAIMAALRRAEAGQRMVGVYDDLMGRVITAFGQASS